MDNLAESGPSQNPEIPENWNFSEREGIGRGMHVTQLAADQKFIALSGDDRTEYEGDGEQIEKVFDNDGNQKDIKGADSNIYSDEDRVLGYIKIERDIPIYYTFRDDSKYYLSVRFGKDSDKLNKFGIFDTVGSVSYSSDGKLSYISMPINFLEGESEEKIEAPFLALELIEGGVSEVSEDWKEDQKIPISDGDGEDFQTSWKIDKGIMVITQKHLSSGLTKVLSAPIKIDIEAVNNAFAAKAPHPEQKFEGKTMVDIPWMKIPGLVGAKLSYSGSPVAP